MHGLKFIASNELSWFLVSCQQQTFIESFVVDLSCLFMGWVRWIVDNMKCMSTLCFKGDMTCKKVHRFCSLTDNETKKNKHFPVFSLQTIDKRNTFSNCCFYESLRDLRKSIQILAYNRRISINFLVFSNNKPQKKNWMDSSCFDACVTAQVYERSDDSCNYVIKRHCTLKTFQHLLFLSLCKL